MSKKVFTVIGLIALGFATFGIATLGAGVGFGAGLATAAPGILGAFTIGQVALAGVVLLGAGLFKEPTFDIAGDIDARLQVRTDPDASRNVIIGEIELAGVLRYRNVIELGDKEVMWIVLVLAGYPCDSIQGFKLNGEDVTLVNPTGDGAVSGKFANKLFVFFRDGRATTPAFPEITTDETAALPVGSGIWGLKTRVGRAMCTVAIKAIPDKDFNGRLEPLFKVRGARLYDPRLDSTRGGTGLHRFNDESTFEWSNVGVDQLGNNPVIAELNFLRGFFWPDSAANDQLIAGRGLVNDPDRIDFASVIAGANVCDEDVNVLPSGTIDRYTMNGIIDTFRAWDEILFAMDTSHGGSTTYSGGQFQFYPAIWRSPTLTFDETDIIGVPSRVGFSKNPLDRVNVVRGSFSDQNTSSQLVEYPSQKDTASIALVGERQLTVNFPFTTDHRICQRIAKLSMNRQNAARAMAAQFTHRAIKLGPGGEGISLTYALYNFSAQAMRIEEWSMTTMSDKQGRPGIGAEMALTEDDVSFYTWVAATDEQSIDTPDLLPPIATRTPVETTFVAVPNVDADGVADNGEVAVVGIDEDGVPDFTKSGSLRWGGSRIVIPRDAGDGFTFVGGGIGRRIAILLFDTDLPTTPRFTANSQARHTVLAYKENATWFYDTGVARQSFTPIRDRDVALGWVEIDGDLILDAHTYGSPRPYELVEDARSDRTSVNVPHIALSNSWSESFDEYRNEDDFLRNWEIFEGSPTITFPNNGINGGKVLRVDGYMAAIWRTNVPWDFRSIYRFATRVRSITHDAANEDLLIGLFGVMADGTTIVNLSGANSITAAQMPEIIEANRFDMGLLTVDEWQRLFAWVGQVPRGLEDGEKPYVPLGMPLQITTNAIASYMRPAIIVNEPSVSTSVVEIDEIDISRRLESDVFVSTMQDPNFALADDQLYWEFTPDINGADGKVEAGQGDNGSNAYVFRNFGNESRIARPRFPTRISSFGAEFIVTYKIIDNATGIAAATTFGVRHEFIRQSSSNPLQYQNSLQTGTNVLISTLIVDGAFHEVTINVPDLLSGAGGDHDGMLIGYQLVSASASDDFDFFVSRMLMKWI